MNKGPRIRFAGVDFSWGDKAIVRNLSFTLLSASFTSIIGPSGVGKSTLLQLIGGLLHPKRGEIFIDGEEVSCYSEKQWRPLKVKMGYLFQQGALFSDLTVAENIALPLTEYRDLKQEIIQKRVEEALSEVGLKGTGHLWPYQLSGGMIKRVALARALILDPLLLLYDEPFTGLDPISLKQICEVLIKVRRGNLATRIMVSHHISEALLLSDYILFLGSEGIIFFGSPKAFIESQDKRVQAFLPPGLNFKRKEFLHSD